MNVQFELNKNKTTTTWLTPLEIVRCLGLFDLDPCTPVDMPWSTANERYTPIQDGLKQPWFGRVFCNPPYGKEGEPFIKKMKEHGNGILLIFNRAETNTFFNHIWDDADAIFFKKGRIHFCNEYGIPVGQPGSGSVFVAYGKENVKALQNSGLEGKLIILK